MTTITAINPKYQSKVERLYRVERNYQKYNDLDGTFDTEREQASNERQCESLFDRAYNLRCELPMREQNNFDKQHKAIHGY